MMSIEYDLTVGQIGARLIIAVERRDPISKQLAPFSLIGATTKDITIKRPDGSKRTFTGGAVVFTPPPDGEGDGSDGLIEAVTTLSSDLSLPGTYEIQAKIVLGAEDGFTQTDIFTVRANL